MTTKTCPCCTKEYEPTHARAKTCGREPCVQAWRNEVRYHDEEAGRKHREAKARHVLKYHERYGPVRVATAIETLEGIKRERRNAKKKGGKAK